MNTAPVARPLFILLLVLINLNVSFSQSNFHQEFQLSPEKVSGSAINIDGSLDENVWEYAQKTTPFWESKPNDQALAKTQTTVQVAYDSKYLYVAARIEGRNFVSQTRKRDQGFWNSESFAVILDPMNRRSNGFFFGLSANNVQSDDLLGSVLFKDMTFSWDNKWLSATLVHDRYWTLEMAIPLRILPYTSGNLEWGINFVRPDFNNNQITTWTKVPVNFWPIDLGQTGALVWKEAPARPGKNIAVIPYATGGVIDNIEENKVERKLNAGFDAKYAITPSLNLDLTVNPDFSQIEVDAQQTNLGRFSLYFPERRTFFLENSDIFADYAIPEFMTPFFSRKIGLDDDGNTIPIQFGARLSGNVTPALRIGAMYMQTAANASHPQQNYSAISFNQRVLKRSTIKVYFLNRASKMDDAAKQTEPMLAYGRNAGAEFQFINSSGKLSFTPSLHYSWKEGVKTDNWFYNIQTRYKERNYQFFTDFINVGTRYYADMGFSTRLKTYDMERDTSFQVGFKEWYNRFDYFIRPKKSQINTITLNVWNSHVWNPDHSTNENIMEFTTAVELKNRSNYTFKVNRSNINLQYAFELTDKLIVEKAVYDFTKWSIQYNSSNIKPFYYAVTLGQGGYYGGQILTIKPSFTYRLQPWGNFTIKAEWNQIRMNHTKENILLISPKTEVNFTNNLFWTTFFQYNTQANHFNINSRLQWRYKPMSDFFLVYTDNYFVTPGIHAKNRALVFKLNFWLNL
ncbi:hypothetical protein DYBT9275_02351 [Dyadobacter sp. CECT 9275]|uniref:Carbohydrate family 9 binding domain-like n=1 Tax=Dyadobacter helix TaxID=2822344 RepID=A0A916JC13_9BACT|nr:carbohydrate binding family 9 domain-containing protein [Dyadobacter sp. CECT 9275]CAG4999949.1 hypothetical protein DYBT9275_02351 [Dyadobacter sp. CECT 9275]